MSEFLTLCHQQLIRALKKTSFSIKRTKKTYSDEKRNPLVTIPYLNRDLSRSTLQSILRQFRLPVEELKPFLRPIYSNLESLGLP